MFDFLLRPVRELLGATERDISHSIHDVRDIERQTLDAVDAIEKATSSIERHVASLDTLAGSIDPLRESVDRLSTTLEQVVKLLGPVGAAEREVSAIEHLFGHRREHEEPKPES